MWLKWHRRLQEQPELRDINNWPQIDEEALDPKQRKIFHRNRRMIAQALVGKSLKTIAQENNVDPSGISMLLKRALGGDSDSPAPCTYALIPHTRIGESKRRIPLSKLSAENGAKGAFSHLLNTVPRLQERMDSMIRAFVKNKANGQNLTPKLLHSEFKRLLSDAQWPTDVYPYTEASQAYESVRKYLHIRINEFSVSTSPTRTILSSAVRRACREIQIDEHTIDLFGRVEIVLNGNLIPLRLARCKLILAVDSETDCYLGYHLALSQEVNQYDMLTFLDSLLVPWSPLQLTFPGLQYTPGACFPSYLGGRFTRLGFGIVRLDNALVHLAGTVRSHICKGLSATLNLGLPAQPKARGIIEHAFRIVCSNTHRFPSTTGSNPVDPKRESRKNSRLPPLITLQAFEEILSVILTDHNVKPQAQLANQSPLDLFRYQHAKFPIRLLPPERSNSRSPFIQSAFVPVKHIIAEKRRPHINFLYVRYVGDALNSCVSKREKIRIEYDLRDIRRLKAFSLKGEFLGEISCQGGWKRFPHSVQTRKIINKRVRRQRIAMDDPLCAYFAYVLEKRDLPSMAKELVRITREFGVDVSDITLTERSAESRKERSVNTSERSESRIVSWRSTTKGYSNERARPVKS